MDLGPAGNARLDPLAMCVDRELVAQLLVVRDGVRARTDQAHLADEHVDQLRQLIDRGRANKAPDACNARIVLLGLFHVVAALGDAHRAKLPDEESLAVEAATRLFVDDWPARLCNDRQRDDREQWREDQQSQSSQSYVEESLEQHRGFA